MNAAKPLCVLSLYTCFDLHSVQRFVKQYRPQINGETVKDRTEFDRI